MGGTWSSQSSTQSGVVERVLREAPDKALEKTPCKHPCNCIYTSDFLSHLNKDAGSKHSNHAVNACSLPPLILLCVEVGAGSDLHFPLGSTLFLEIPRGAKQITVVLSPMKWAA